MNMSKYEYLIARNNEVNNLTIEKDTIEGEI